MKKIKQILSLLLCLIICIGLPSTVQAAEYQPTKIMINFVRSDNSGTYQVKDYIPYGVNYSNINEIKQLNFTVFTDGSISCNSGDLVNISIKQTYNRYAYSFSMPAPYSYIRATDKNGNEFRIAEGEGVYENYNFKFVDVSVPRDCTIDSIVFAFDPRGIQYKDWTNSQACGIGFSNCIVTVESEQTGFFNSIKEFFQQLFEKLTNGLDNIGNWFTELGNNIKSFFTDLTNNIKEQFTNMINNLKTFFSDVGKWFKDIGDRIGEFFTNLWNNITVTINGITDGVKEWWQGIVDWFDSLFKVSDGYFDEYGGRWDEWFSAHFGIAYQAISLIDDIINSINKGLSKGNISVVTIPHLLFFVGDEPIYIARQTSLNLKSFYNEHSMLANFLTMFRIMSSAVIIICLVNYAHKFINNNVLQSEGDG